MHNAISATKDVVVQQVGHWSNLELAGSIPGRSTAMQQP